MELKPLKNLAEDCFKLRLSDFGKKLLYPVGTENMDSYDLLCAKENKTLRGKEGYFTVRNGSDALRVFYNIDPNRIPKFLKIKFQNEKIDYGVAEQNIEIEEDIITFGIRPFFTCTCGKFCTVLYKPERENIFKCRFCHNITYESQRLNKRTLQGVLYYASRLIKLAERRERIKRMFYGGGLSRKGRRFTELYNQWSGQISTEARIKAENHILAVANGEKDGNTGLSQFL